jgi:hypothetical protein
MKSKKLPMPLKVLMGILFFLNLVDTVGTWVGVKVLRIGVEMNPVMDFVLNFNSFLLFFAVKMVLVGVSLFVIDYSVTRAQSVATNRLALAIMIGLSVLYGAICSIHTWIFWEHFYG